jgi:hypothetical protein
MKRSLVLTEYWSGTHRPYTNMLHDGDTDEDLGQLQPDVLRELVEESGAVDGDEIEITIRRTGRRPFGDRKIRLVKPHTYERESA